MSLACSTFHVAPGEVGEKGPDVLPGERRSPLKLLPPEDLPGEVRKAAGTYSSSSEESSSETIPLYLEGEPPVGA